MDCLIPENLDLARAMEKEVRQSQSIPVTIAIIDGKVRIGLMDNDLVRLASERDAHKVSSRDIATAVALGWDGGTTVAGTLAIAHMAGIHVFATGGIGGVHRHTSDGPTFDISADLPQLAHTPMIVVCAGAKAILDLPATVEYLETWGIPVIGFRTDEFPAFYSRQSGLPISARVDEPEAVVRIALANWQQGLKSAILVVNPPPVEVALPADQIEAIIQMAMQDMQTSKVGGQQVSPFLLKRVTELTGGASMRANLGLLLNNARLAAQIAACWSGV
jgi:pseudouridine-5'-phosphate glycosidase